MTKELVFEFSGTKDDFLNSLSRFSGNNRQFYYFSDYIVKIVDDEIHFGVERAGHSDGYWYIPEITERDGKTELRGKIKYIGAQNKNTSIKAKNSFFKKCAGIVVQLISYILIFPVAFSLLVFSKVYKGFKFIQRRLLRQPDIKAMTREEKLIDLMEKQLNCIRK